VRGLNVKRTKRLAIAIAVLAVGCIAAAGTTAAAYVSRPSTTPPAAAAKTGTQAVQGLATTVPLKGKIVGIDPGHNGGNFNDPSYLSQQVWNGREWENCDTTGTETDGAHYTEALFNWHVANYLKAYLIKAGAKVVMTRTSNTGVGPCVNTRAFKLNLGHANVAVDIHADGAYGYGNNGRPDRGFAILLPVDYTNPNGTHGANHYVIRSSRTFGADVKAAMLANTKMPVSNYDGTNGFAYRTDLAGLNLTKVPKMLLEVGNMKNPTDAAMLTSAAFQQQVAKALLAAIIKFLG
jgi:N-acetylmuramoyl-L-alanine amidase